MDTLQLLIHGQAIPEGSESALVELMDKLSQQLATKIMEHPGWEAYGGPMYIRFKGSNGYMHYCFMQYLVKYKTKKIEIEREEL